MHPGDPWGELALPVFAALLSGETLEDADRAALHRRLGDLLPSIDLLAHPGPVKELAWVARRDIQKSVPGSDLFHAAKMVLERLESPGRAQNFSGSRGGGE